MKHFLFFIMLVCMSGVCAAQNTDDGSKYMSNPKTALTDARKALDTGEYERAKTLAKIYNSLTGSNLGNDVITEADNYIIYYEHINKASKLFVSQQYIDAIKEYLFGYSSSAVNDTTLFTDVEKCSAVIVSSKIKIPAEQELGEQLFKFYKASSHSVKESINTIQVAALCGNPSAAFSAGQFFLEQKEYLSAASYLEIARSGGMNVANNLGCCYSNLANKKYGSDKEDYLKKAYKCFEESANNNVPEGQFNLATCLRDGDGCAKDLYAARFWFKKSYSNGYEIAKEQYDKLNEHLNRKQADSLKWVPTVINEPDGGKGKFDWDDLLMDDRFIGARYSYGKSIPVSLALVGNYHLFGGYRVEAGYINSPVVYSHEKNVIDEHNLITLSEKTMYMPTFYVTAAPGLFFRYFSIDIGIGAMISPRMFYDYQTWGVNITTVTINGESVTKYEQTPGNHESIGDVSFSNGKVIATSSDKYGWIHFMLQPTLAVMLPISDDSFIISAHVGYNYIPDCSQICNFSFGIGFLWNID